MSASRPWKVASVYDCLTTHARAHSQYASLRRANSTSPSCSRLRRQMAGNSARAVNQTGRHVAPPSDRLLTSKSLCCLDDRKLSVLISLLIYRIPMRTTDLCIHELDTVDREIYLIPLWSTVCGYSCSHLRACAAQPCSLQPCDVWHIAMRINFSSIIRMIRSRCMRSIRFIAYLLV